MAMENSSDSKSPHLVLALPYREPVAILDRLRKNHPQFKITYRQITHSKSPFIVDTEIPKELFHDATILATASVLPESPEDCPDLKLIQFFSAGIDHIVNSPIYKSTSIPLATASGIHGPTIAEWVLLTALVHSRKYDILHAFQTEHNWSHYSNDSPLNRIRDRVGRRLGVLGYGSIGRQVARVAKAMGMDVIAYTAHPRPTPESKKDKGFIVPGTGDPDGSIPTAWFSGLDKASLHDFLAQDIDHLLISVPITPDTKHFLAAPEFAILGQRNAFISNIARGQILQQDDLIAALEQGARNNGKDGGLGGAALDVADPEPLPKDHPLWDAPNCIVTPHISGLSTEYRDRSFQVLETNLKLWEEGKELINVVNRKSGY